MRRYTVKQKLKSAAAFLIILIFLPYVVSVFVNGVDVTGNNSGSPFYIRVRVPDNEEADGVGEVEWTEYLAGILAEEMPKDSEEEALKAQAVLIRTQICRELEESEDKVLEENYLTAEELRKRWGAEEFDTAYKKYVRAIEETDDTVLLYGDTYAWTPFHQSSAGMTRSAAEAMGTDQYPYVAVRECPFDKKAEDEIQVFTFTCSEIQKLCRDFLVAVADGDRASMGYSFEDFEITKYDVTNHSMEIKNAFDEFEGKEVTLAGRMMSKRVMGKASFCHVQDLKGTIQSYVARDSLGEEAYKDFKKLDVGDIIGVKGQVFRTKTGEISIHASEITLLSKSLQVLPEKFHGLTNTDLRYRQRYVDLIVNPEVRDVFVKRSQIIRELRSFLDSKGYLEVETPVLHNVAGGAAARPFITHHNTLNMDMVLRIETELYLKRLVVGGMDRVYEVGRIFRNEGMDPKHNPEFTSIELYQAFTDYHGMMDLVEELYKRLAEKICGSLVIPYQGKQIDMGHWERLTMVEAVKKYSGVDYHDWKTDSDAITAAKAHNVDLPEVPTRGSILAAFFDAFVEDKLIQPTFIYDYPVENSPLAKRKPENPAYTERFEYFIDCTEYGNAFSELNDPIDQKERFERQVAERKQIDPDSKAQVDYDYVTALEYGLPPTGGMGMGVDRLVMLLTGAASIRDVLLFPTMKPLD